jgi:hypothetical protein
LANRRTAIANKRHKPDEIVTKLRQVEVLRRQGMAMADAVRQIGVSELTYRRTIDDHRKPLATPQKDALRSQPAPSSYTPPSLPGHDRRSLRPSSAYRLSPSVEDSVYLGSSLSQCSLFRMQPDQ